MWLRAFVAGRGQNPPPKSRPPHERRRLIQAWLAKREQEYRDGKPCGAKLCNGVVHTEKEFSTGRWEDGRLNCFGYARIKLDDLHYEAKAYARKSCCRRCGRPLSRDWIIDGQHAECYRRGQLLAGILGTSLGDSRYGT